MSATAEPVRRRKNDRSEVPVSFLPDGNPSARRAYLCALFGLIPPLGVVLGPVAIGLGILGRRAALRDEFNRGMGHAYMSRLLGAIVFICHGGGLACLARAAGLL
jgi:hypothetical protein